MRALLPPFPGAEVALLPGHAMAQAALLLPSQIDDGVAAPFFSPDQIHNRMATLLLLLPDPRRVGCPSSPPARSTTRGLRARGRCHRPRHKATGRPVEAPGTGAEPHGRGRGGEPWRPVAGTVGGIHHREWGPRFGFSPNCSMLSMIHMHQLSVQVLLDPTSCWTCGACEYRYLTIGMYDTTWRRVEMHARAVAAAENQPVDAGGLIESGAGDPVGPDAVLVLRLRMTQVVRKVFGGIIRNKPMKEKR